jgi:hypothetical protein
MFVFQFEQAALDAGMHGCQLAAAGIQQAIGGEQQHIDVVAGHRQFEPAVDALRHFEVRTGICQTAECLIDHAVDSRCIAPGQRVARQPHHIAHLLHAAVGEQGVRACIDLHRLQGQWSERRGQGADVGDASSGGAMCQPARGTWSGRARAERPEAGSRQIAAYLAQQGVESAEQLHAAGNVHQQTIGFEYDSGGVTQCAAGSVP